MFGNVVLKPTLSEKEGFLRLPYAFLSADFEKFSFSELFSAAKIATFSCVKDQPTARCRSRHSDFAKDFRITERHSVRVIKQLMKASIIEKVTDENGKIERSKYRYVGDRDFKEGFIRIDMFLLHTKFVFRSKVKGSLDFYERYLTLSEIFVLSYMLTHCNNPKKRKFEGSIRSIARKLNMSPSTVSKCISNLNKADLIFRQKEDTAVNGSGWSVYRVNESLLRKTNKQYQKESEASAQPSQSEQQRVVAYVSPAVAAANARADRERFYARRREKATAPAEEKMAQAKRDSKCKEAFDKLRSLEFAEAKADVYGALSELKKVKQEQARWKIELKKRLKAIGLIPEDLSPRWFCSKCSDTGFLPNGKSCDCYPGSDGL